PSEVPRRVARLRRRWDQQRYATYPCQKPGNHEHCANQSRISVSASGICWHHANWDRPAPGALIAADKSLTTDDTEPISSLTGSTGANLPHAAQSRDRKQLVHMKRILAYFLWSGLIFGIVLTVWRTAHLVHAAQIR